MASYSIEPGNIFAWKDSSKGDDEFCVDVVISYDKNHPERNFIMRYNRVMNGGSNGRENFICEFRPFSLYYDNKWWVKIT